MKTKNMPDNVSSLLTRSRNGRILKSCRTAEQSCNAESDESSGEKHGEDISVDDDSIESNDVNKEEDQRKVYTNFSSESLHLPNPDQSFEYERRKEKSKKAYVNPKRFRGFSTSVKALFLDETGIVGSFYFSTSVIRHAYAFIFLNHCTHFYCLFGNSCVLCYFMFRVARVLSI